MEVPCSGTDCPVCKILKPEIETCWGCSSDYLQSWSKYDLGHITSFVTGNVDVLVCPDCREEIESIEKENTDE